MKKKFLAALLAATMALSMTACGGNENIETDAPQEKVYVDESEISNVFANPDEYEGKYIELSGVIFNKPGTEGESSAYQVWADPVDYNYDFLFITNDNSFANDDYVIIEGKLTGAFEGENAFGAETSCPVIEAETVTKSTYMDVVAPTIAELSPAVSAEQHGITVTVDKVEYSDVETRVYMTITNASATTASFGIYSARIIQDGKQIELDSNSSSAYMGDYPELSYDLSAGASTSGILVFPVIDQAKDFQVILPDNYSDDWELEFTDFALNITTAK